MRRAKVAAMTEEGRRWEQQRLALLPPPRKECPVCLFTLMDEFQEDIGHHPYCADRIEGVLRKAHEEVELAKVFRVPDHIKAAHRRVLQLHEVAEAAGAHAIETRLAWWKALGHFRHECMRAKVCFACGQLPALPSNLCKACEAVWREEWAEAERRG